MRSKTGTEISAPALTDPKFGIEIERILCCLFQSSMLRNVVNGLSKSTLHRVDGRLVLLLLNQVQLSLPDDFNAMRFYSDVSEIALFQHYALRTQAKTKNLEQ